MSSKQCYYCGKTFTRGYNLRRHLDNHICKMDGFEENESRYDEETSNKDEIASSAEEDSDVDTSESESNDTEDEHDYDNDQPNEDDCWSVLINEAMDRHVMELDALENQYMEEGESKASAEVRAYNEMIPVFRNELRNVLLEKLEWIRALKRDSYYRKIIRSRQDLLNTGDYDWMEATQVAINHRKFLLNRLFTIQTQTDEDEKDME